MRKYRAVLPGEIYCCETDYIAGIPGYHGTRKDAIQCARERLKKGIEVLVA